MRLILQRVSSASVTIGGRERRETGPGLAILVGFCSSDSTEICEYMAAKAVGLRIFSDENGDMNRSLLDTGGGCLIVSNFTLYASSRKGRRPSFAYAAPPSMAEPLYRRFIEAVRGAGVAVISGEFGSDMLVEIANDGPVTIILDSGEIMPASKQPGPG